MGFQSRNRKHPQQPTNNNARTITKHRRYPIRKAVEAKEKTMAKNFGSMNNICLLVIWLLLCVSVKGADQDPDPVNPNFNATYSPLAGVSTANVVLSNDARLSTFKNLLDRSGVSPSIAKTIIAPTKGAWESFRNNDTRRFDQWTTQPEFFVHFKDLMEWHMVIEENYTYEEIFNGRRRDLVNPQGEITVYQEPVQMIDNVFGSDFSEPDIHTAEGMVHVVDRVLLPPFFGYDMITQLLHSRQEKFSFSNMANLALHVGLEERLTAVYNKGITFLVPPNRRFNRAEIDVPRLLDKDMFNYTRDFILCHMIKDNHHVAQLFATTEKTGEDQFLVKSELGTHMWITTTEDKVRFQSQELLVPDQPTPNGYVKKVSRQQQVFFLYFVSNDQKLTIPIFVCLSPILLLSAVFSMVWITRLHLPTLQISPFSRPSRRTSIPVTAIGSLPSASWQVRILPKCSIQL